MHQTKSPAHNVYIGETASLLPALVPAIAAADKIYPLRLCSKRANAFAKRASKNFGIKERAISLDLDQLPQKRLKDKRHHPLEWCVSIVQDLTRTLSVDEIGYLGVTYNASFHANTLPNLACQTAMRTGIKPEIAPAEFVNYGCAGGFFPMESAVEYCRRNQKAAIVIAFDQCTTRGMFCYDTTDEMFKTDLKVNLLFSDGAAGVLILPERLRNLFSRKLPKICDLLTDFWLTDLIRFENRGFILGDRVCEEVPPLVATSVIKPVLARNNLSASEVEEWSIHQGSLDIVGEFAKPEILGLSAIQLEKSKELFKRYGNLSSPSCFLVLDHFFKEKEREKNGVMGMMVSFGAGFYQGSMLYRWE